MNIPQAIQLGQEFLLGLEDRGITDIDAYQTGDNPTMPTTRMIFTVTHQGRQYEEKTLRNTVKDTYQWSPHPRVTSAWLLGRTMGHKILHQIRQQALEQQTT